MSGGRGTVPPLGSAIVSGLALTLALACQRSSGAPGKAPSPEQLPPPLPPEQVSAPVLSRGAGGVPVTPAPAPEKRITVTTYGHDSDVRPLLQFIAESGGFSLVMPTELDRRVNVDLRNVTVSEALEAVLAAAHLSLAPTNGITAPADTAVVFYQLPVNVDSLSADAIMKRFGVSREIAEMIVRARKP